MSKRNINIRINIESYNVMTVNIININRDRDKSEREMIGVEDRLPHTLISSFILPLYFTLQIANAADFHCSLSNDCLTVVFNISKVVESIVTLSEFVIVITINPLFITTFKISTPIPHSGSTTRCNIHS